MIAVARLSSEAEIRMVGVPTANVTAQSAIRFAKDTNGSRR